MESFFATLGQAAGTNLLAPATLFFALGLGAAWARSDLAVPEQVSKALALYLMLCIGFKGGVEARAAGLDGPFLTAAALGLAFSLALPFLAFALIRLISRLDTPTAAATAAHYGSVSVVTFAAGAEYLRAIGLAPSGHMAAVLALMETPAIVAALLIVGRSERGKAGAHGGAQLWREVLLNGATVLLVGSFAIGALTGRPGLARLEVFVGPLFQGALCLFLLDMGLIAARRLAAAPNLRPGLVAFAVAFPLAVGCAAAPIGVLAGLSTGDAALLAVLAASASYIAAPAAMRLALPQADAGVYLPMSLGVTFPTNLIAGIPLYAQAAMLAAG